MTIHSKLNFLKSIEWSNSSGPFNYRPCNELDRQTDRKTERLTDREALLGAVRLELKWNVVIAEEGK